MRCELANLPLSIKVGYENGHELSGLLRASSDMGDFQNIAIFPRGYLLGGFEALFSRSPGLEQPEKANNIPPLNIHDQPQFRSLNCRNNIYVGHIAISKMALRTSEAMFY